MHHVSKIEESTARTPKLYEPHTTGFRRATYVDRSMGSVHMGVGVCYLAPGGVIAFHISNRHVDLEPPIWVLADRAGMQSRIVSSYANDARDEFTATWMLVSDNSAFFAQPEVLAHSSPAPHSSLRPWTDDFSSLLPVLRW